jgi:WD40 repeat protein
VLKHTICNKLSLATKQINFTQASFNKAGDRVLVCDQLGNIYTLDLAYNRYQRINRLGVSCTSIAYNLKCKTEYLVATVDGTIKCFNTETRELVGWMKGHEKPVLGLCVQSNGSGTLVISHSHDLAQLWDVNKFECKQKLSVNAKNNVEIVKV